MNYLVLDIETCPVELDGYEQLDEAERKKRINPIDSRLIAIGLKDGNNDIVLFDLDEKKLLEHFWLELKTLQKTTPRKKIVGFNIKDFDLPFLVTRSFINDVEIVPFKLTEIVDLREKISAFRYGPTRGKLKEYGKFLEMILHEKDGSDVAELCIAKDWKQLTEYLKKDLEITNQMLTRLVKTRIIEIERW